MGSSDDIMQHFIENDIHRHFPACEGWGIVPMETFSGYDQVFRIQRWTIKGDESILLGFSFQRRVPEQLLERLRMRDSGFGRKAFLGPKGSDMSGLEPGVETYSMKNFANLGALLIWLKHPTVRFERSMQMRRARNNPVMADK